MEKIIGISTAQGRIEPPPSKSLAHRYIICAGLCEGRSVISNVDYSEDIKASLDCIMALGAKVNTDADKVTIDGASSASIPESIDFLCRESGSTMRFFMGLAMYFGKPSKFYGSPTLRNRPFSVYENICSDQNITFAKEGDHIYVNGNLSFGTYEIPGDISSQFITGLMFVLPLLNGDSVIKLIPPVESKSYLNLTMQAMKAFGVEVTWINETDICVKGGQHYKPNNVRVEADYSNAAFLDAFNYIGGKVSVEGLNKDSLQGDMAYTRFFPLLAKEKANVDISDCPDLGPVLFSVAAACNGGIFTGTKRLKIKESDRGTVMCAELKKFGVETVQEDNKIEIKKSVLHKPTKMILGHNDHRIVMALSLLLSLTGGVVNEAEAVRKSYPGFFDDIKSLGIEVE